jgi:hypothetical protein
MIRLVFDLHDRVAHRLVLGLRTGVGIGTSEAIASAVINNGLSYWDAFHAALHGGVFTVPKLTALNQARQVCAQIGAWQRDDTLQIRTADRGGSYDHVFRCGRTELAELCRSVARRYDA